MPEEVFIDASYWIAITYPRDQWHRNARTLWDLARENRWQMVTTNWTLYEALTALNGGFGRHDLALALRDLVQDTAIQVFDASDIEDMALNIFVTHADKRWSVVDCANFVCIGERRTPYAFAYDYDFNQAQAEFGFTRLGTPLRGLTNGHPS